MDKAGLKMATSWFTGRVAVFDSMSPVEKWYLVGIFIGGTGALLLVVGTPPFIFAPPFWAAGLFLFIALARESYLIVIGHMESRWVRWLMVPVAVMVSAYSLGSSSNVVNAATGQDPGLFPRATAFMAPLAAIPALALLVSVLASIALFVMFFAWMMQLSSNDKVKAGGAWLWLGRIGGALTAVALLSPLTVENSRFVHFVGSAAGWIAQGLDMHIDRACATGDGDRVLRINDEIVLVARRADDELLFRREICELSAE